MAAVISYDLYPRLAEALGLPAGLLVERLVLVMDQDEAVRVYLKTLANVPDVDKLAGAFKVQAVADVQVGPDMAVVVTPHEPAARRCNCGHPEADHKPLAGCCGNMCSCLQFVPETP